MTRETAKNQHSASVTVEDILPFIPEISAGMEVRAWPEDERELYRREGWRSFDERNEAVALLRRKKVAQSIIDSGLFTQTKTEDAE